MALSDVQKALAFDANKQLKTQVDRLMDNVGTKGLCVPISASYLQMIKIANVMIVPVATFKNRIIDVLNNNDVLDALHTASDALEIINSNIGRFNLQINRSTIQALNIFDKICLNFKDILPNAMKNFLDSVMDDINSREIFDLPDSISNSIINIEEFLINESMSNGFDTAVKTVLNPIQEYRAFIKSSGILDLIKSLQKFERCLTNPKTCNRPKKEFYFPNTRKYNSQYYLDLLCVNLKGEIILHKLDYNFKSFEGQMFKTLRKIDAFSKHPIK